MPEPGSDTLITNAAPGVVGSHDVIINSLDTWRPYLNGDGSTDTLFYGSEVFTGTEKAWETIPVILGKRHPSTPYQHNPVKALEEAEGVVVGTLKDVYITETGSPALKSKLNLTDNQAEDLIKTRKMSMSSGFLSGRGADGKLTGINGKVVPDHLLLFGHDRNNRPQDAACMFLNSTEKGTMPDNESIKSVLSEFLVELKSLIVPARADPVMPVKPEQGMVTNMNENKIAELEKTAADQAELVKNMTAELDAFKKAEDTRLKAEKDQEWNLVKNSIAPGITATAELETAARSEWETNPTKFLLKNSTVKAEEKPAEGVKFVTNGTSNQAEADAEYLKFINSE